MRTTIAGWIEVAIVVIILAMIATIVVVRMAIVLDRLLQGPWY